MFAKTIKNPGVKRIAEEREEYYAMKDHERFMSRKEYPVRYAQSIDDWLAKSDKDGTPQREIHRFLAESYASIRHIVAFRKAFEKVILTRHTLITLRTIQAKAKKMLNRAKIRTKNTEVPEISRWEEREDGSVWRGDRPIIIPKGEI